MSNHKPVEFEGKIYPSHKALANAYNVNVRTLKSIVFRHGVTIEEALHKILGWKKQPPGPNLFELNKFVTMKFPRISC